MARTRTYNKRNELIIVSLIILAAIALMLRLGYLMLFKSEDYSARAQGTPRKRKSNKSGTRNIYDTNKTLIATNNRYVRYLLFMLKLRIRRES